MVDDLKIIKGIGPKIEELLHTDGITTWQKLGETSAEEIKEILTRAGERFVMHDPTTWPRQALDHESKWDELRAWQQVPQNRLIQRRPQLQTPKQTLCGRFV